MTISGNGADRFQTAQQVGKAGFNDIADAWAFVQQLPDGTALSAIVVPGRYLVYGLVGGPTGSTGRALVDVWPRSTTNQIKEVSWTLVNGIPQRAITDNNGGLWAINAYDERPTSPLNVAQTIPAGSPSGNINYFAEGYAGFEYTLTGNLVLVLPNMSVPINKETTHVLRFIQNASTAFTLTIQVGAGAALEWLTEGGAVIGAPALGKTKEIVGTVRNRAGVTTWSLGLGRKNE